MKFKDLNQTQLILLVLASGLALIIFNNLVLKRFVNDKSTYTDDNVNIKSYAEDRINNQMLLNSRRLRTLENFEPSDIQVELNNE